MGIASVLRWIDVPSTSLQGLRRSQGSEDEIPLVVCSRGGCDEFLPLGDRTGAVGSALRKPVWSAAFLVKLATARQTGLRSGDRRMDVSDAWSPVPISEIKTALESTSADARCGTRPGGRRPKVRSGCPQALKGVRAASTHSSPDCRPYFMDRQMGKSTALGHARRACMARKRGGAGLRLAQQRRDVGCGIRVKILGSNPGTPATM